MKQTVSARLLHSVQQRLLVKQIAHRTFLALIVLSVLYGLLLLAGRLTGTFPAWFDLWTLAILPVLSLALGALIPGRPTLQQAARAIDQSQGTKDLFLTMCGIAGPAGEYMPLVELDAERVAPKVKPQLVVPYQWQHPTLVTAGTLALLLAGILFVPTLDPFGKVAEAKEADTARKLLVESQKQTQSRRAELKQKDVEEANSDAVEKAVDALKVGFQEMRKGEQRKNQQRLNTHQKEIGEMYRNLNSGELRTLFDEAKGNQEFGTLQNPELFKEWQKELQSGKSEKLTEELQALQEILEEIAKSKDPVEKSEKERQVKKKLKELAEFAKNRVGSKELNEALNRAMEQLEAGKTEELSKEAMEALQESLKAVEEEMKALAQAARDMEKLEKALETISMAKKVNAEEKFEDDMFDSEMTLEDYAEMYAQLMGSEPNEGTGGDGMGMGDSVDEDDSVETGFVDKKSKSAIQQGKILLSMKTKGLSENGEIKDQEYQRAVREITQSLDDVIDQEQIPPGYVDGIKKYFDTLEAPPQ